MNKLKKCAVIICLTISVVSAIVMALSLKEEAVQSKELEVIAQKAQNYVQEIKNPYTELKKEYPDLTAYIQTDDISLPVMNSDEYLYKNIDGDKTELGIPFSLNTPQDSNFIIYGHSTVYNDESYFTPLLKLKDQEYYEKHDKIIIYSSLGISQYAITNVYLLSNDQFDEYDYQVYNFTDKEEFVKFMEFPNTNNLIESINGEIDFSDKFITLQTCNDFIGNEKLIIIARKII